MSMIDQLSAAIAELNIQHESDAKVIDEKDAEIRSMIAIHNSDVDGTRMQEEKIADQKKVIAALRAALRDFAVRQHVRMAQGGGTVPNGYSCKICGAECERDMLLIHDVRCLLAIDEPDNERELHGASMSEATDEQTAGET
jgi:hypothetical protein